MEQSYINAILPLLESWSKGEGSLSDKREGICHNLRRVVDSSQRQSDELSDLMMKWPKFSGDAIFPVPAPLYIDGVEMTDPQDAYMFTTNQWKGDYGNLRKELCGWLVEQLKETVKCN